MRELSKDDRLFYFEKNWFTLDGLWIIETEKATSFETALNIDLAVWKELFKIIYRRIKNYLKTDATTIEDVLDILAFRWTCEGWTFRTEMLDECHGHAAIEKCPYKEVMSRNPERRDVIPHICKDICIPIYEEAIASINPAVHVTRRTFMGLGDETCDFDLQLESPE
jgi:hypothetical protein